MEEDDTNDESGETVAHDDLIYQFPPPVTDQVNTGNETVHSSQALTIHKPRDHTNFS